MHVACGSLSMRGGMLPKSAGQRSVMKVLLARYLSSPMIGKRLRLNPD